MSSKKEETMVGRENKMFRSEDSNIYELHGKEGAIPLNIPPYQRDMVWEEEQCNQLIIDIMEATIKNDYHFTGPIYIKKYNDYYDIIDGQQRLTSIGLLMIAIKNTAEEIKSKKITTIHRYENSELDEIIEEANKYLYTPEHKIKLKLHTNDMAAYEALIKMTFERACTHLTKQQKKSRIIENYKVFKQFVSHWVQSNHHLKELADCPKRLLIIKAFVNNQNAMSIFKRINATGVPLDDIDLIRNLLFIPFDREKADVVYEKYWEKIETYVQPENMMNFLESLIPILTQKYTTKQKSKYNTFPIYNMFEHYYNNTNKTLNEEGKSEKILKIMLYYAAIYNKLLYPKDFIMQHAEPLDQKIYELTNAIKVKNCNSILLYLYDLLKNDKIDKEDFMEAIWPLTVYNFRSQIAPQQDSMRTKEAQTLLLHIIGARTRNPKMNIAEYIWNELVSTYQIITKEEAERIIQKDQIYLKIGNTQFMKYLLYIYNKAKTKPGKKLIPFLPDEQSVYRIIPPQETQKWKKDLNIQSWDEAKEYINRTGNLVYGKFSGMGSKSFNEKRPYLDTSGFPGTKATSNESVWVFETVEKYSADIAKCVTEYFKGPKKYENIISEQKH